MPGEILQNINKNNDTEICIDEIRNFSRDENNIPKIRNSLKEKEKSELLSSLENSLNTAIDTILGQSEILENDIKILDLWNKLLGEKEEGKLKEVQKELEKKINNMSIEVNKKIARNEKGNINYYDKKDIQLVQLRANICFRENIPLDGKRGNLFYSSENSENQKLTNLYIYKQEFITRQGVIDARKEFKRKEFDQLLNIPNLQELLNTLGSIEEQNKVFSKFLDFVLKIRVAGMFFENKIGNESILPVLNYMINAEKYKKTSVEEYFADIDIEGNINKTVKFKEDIKTLGYKTMYDYYNTMYIRYKDTKIEDFIKGLEGYPEKEEELKKSFSGFETAGEYYKSLLTTVNKNVTIDKHFEEQEDMLKNFLKLKKDIKVSTMGEYFQNTYPILMSNIVDTNKINIQNNTIVFKKQEKDRIKKEIIELENKLKQYSIKEQYGGGKIPMQLLQIQDSPIEYIETNPACTTAVSVNNKKNMDYALYSFGKTEEEKAQYLKENGFQTLDANILNDRLFTDRGKVQIQILELKLQLYMLNKDESSLNDFYLYLQKTFSDKDIKNFFELKSDNPNCKLSKSISEYGVSYQGFQNKIGELSQRLNHVGQTYEEFEEIRDTNDLLTRINGKIIKVVDGGLKPSYRMHPDGYVYQVKDERSIKITMLRGGEEIVETMYMPEGFNVTAFNTQIKSLPKNQYITDYPSSLGFPFAIVKHENNGDINLYECKNITDMRPGKIIKNLSSSTIEKTNKYNKTVMDMGQDYETTQALSILSDFAGDFEGVWSIYKKFAGTEESERQPITDPEADKVLNRAVDFKYEKLEKYENSIPLLKTLLAKLDSGSANAELYSLFSEQRNFLANMIGFFETGQARQCIDLLTSVESNNEGREKLRIWIKNNLVQMLFAIAGAVIAIVLAAPSGGISILAYIKGMTLFTSAAGALGCMVGGRIGQVTNEGIQNTFFAKTVNGYTIEYDNPTDVELFIAGKITAGDFFTGLAGEFIIGTITTFGFIKAGQIIGKGLVQAGVKNVDILRPSTQMGRCMEYSKKIISPRMNAIANNSTKSFGRSFGREFGEETFEESIEGIGEQIHPVLGGIIQIVNCLSGPKVGNLFQKYNVASGLTNIEGNKIVQQMTYNADNIQELESYFKDTQGYSFVSSSDGKVRIEKPIKDQKDIIKSKSGKTLDTHVIEFIPSKAGVFVNNSAEFFAQYGMKINHQSESNEVIANNNVQLQMFIMAVTVGGLGTITTNPDGSVKFTTGNETINIVPGKMIPIMHPVNVETEIHIATKKVSELTPKDLQSISIHSWIKILKNSGYKIEGDISSRSITLDGKEITLNQLDGIIDKAKKEVEVRNNANLSPEARISKAKELLGSINDSQKQAILDAHNQDGTIFNLNFSQIRARVEILSKAGLDSNQIRILIENGICGQAESSALDVDKNGKFDSRDVDVMNIKSHLNDIGITLDESFFTEFSRESFFRQKMRNESMSKSEAYIAYFEGIADVATKLENYLYVFTEVGNNPSVQEVIDLVKEDISVLPTQERVLFVNGIIEYINTMKVVDGYLSDPLYKENPKLLVAKIFGIDANLIEGDILISKEGGVMVFDIEKSADYAYIEHGQQGLTASSGGRMWAATNLGFSIGILNKGMALDNVDIHERKHATNASFFAEYIGGKYDGILNSFSLEDILIASKDEITAYYKDGSSIDNIYQILSKPGLEGGLYDYIFQKFNDNGGLTEQNSNEYKQERSVYIEHLNQNITYIYCFDYLTKLENSNLSKDKLANILSVTPLSERGNLLDNYKKSMNINKTNEDIVILNICNEAYRGGRNYNGEVVLVVLPEYMQRGNEYDNIARDALDMISIFNNIGINNYLDVLLKTPTDQRLQLKNIYKKEISAREKQQEILKYKEERDLLGSTIDFYQEQLLAYQNNTFERSHDIILKEGETFDQYRDRIRAEKIERLPKLIEEGKHRLQEIHRKLDDLENNKTKPNHEAVKLNAALADGPRLQIAETLPGLELAGKLINPDGSPTTLGQKILDAHNNSKGGEVYNISKEQLMEKVRILDKAGLDSNQIRILIENGICGQAEVSALDVNKDGVFDGRDVEMVGNIIDKSEVYNEGKEKNIIDVKKEKKIKKEEVSEKVKNTYDEIVVDLQQKINNGIDVEKNTYIIKSMENLAKTSRTALGFLDASASENKQFKFEAITPENAGIQALENFQKLSEYTYENRNMQFASVGEVKAFVEKIAKEVNDGILKPEYFMRDENPSLDKDGKPKYPYTEVQDMNIAFAHFCKSFFKKLNDPKTDPIELAAWIEYRVNLKDHFFADGCGKISIALSNFVLMRYGKELPDIRDGKERFKYSSKEQRNAKDPNHEPDLNNWTNYYKTMYIMKDIVKCKDNTELDTYVAKYNTEGNGPKGNEIMIGNHNNNFIILNQQGKIKRIEPLNSEIKKGGKNLAFEIYENENVLMVNEKGELEYLKLSNLGKRLEKFEGNSITKENAKNLLKLVKLDKNERLSNTYELRKKILEKNETIKTHEAFTYGNIPDTKILMKKYIADEKNRLPERVKMHNEIFENLYESATKLSERLSENGPQLILMRGNTASGKTFTLKNGTQDAVVNLRNQMKNEQGKLDGIINPDDVKSIVRSKEQGINTNSVISHFQTHSEGSMITEKLIDRMFTESKSLVIDKRFNDMESLNDEILPQIDGKGYKVTMIDVDRNLEQSCKSVLDRPVDGTDPNVPFDGILEGFEGVRGNREVVSKLTWIDQYYVYHNGELVGSRTDVVASRKNSEDLIIHNNDLRKKITTVDKNEIESAKVLYKKDLNDLAFNRKKYLIK